MRKTEIRKKLSPPVIAAILTAVLVLAIAVSLIVHYTREDATREPMVPPVPLEGEDVYNNYLIAYPTMTEKDIQYIEVKNSTGTFGVVRPESDGSFVLYYKDASGNPVEYRPNISELDDNFEYRDLFAVEAGDGYNSILKLSYLCMALQLPYVEERIELTPEEREAQLDVYGLGEGEYETITFTYLKLRRTERLDADGKPVVGSDGKPVYVDALDENGDKIYDEVKHTIRVGDKTTLGTGFYFMVDSREYVYAGFSPYFEYAMTGFNSFVNSILVAPGLDADGVFGGFITSDYYQWLLEKHELDGETVKENSDVLTLTNTIIPIRRTDVIDSALPSGYISSGYSELSFDLYDYRGKSEYKKLIDALVGKTVGNYYGNDITVTLTSQNMPLDFGDKSVLHYEYAVTVIESVITDTDELSAQGTPVGDANLVKVTYALKIDGVPASYRPLHAVIDLSDPLLPPFFVSAMRASSVGSFAEPLVFDIFYTPENAATNQVEYIISDILEIRNQNGESEKTINDSSTVTYNYYLKVNGKYDSDEPYTAKVYFATDKSEDAVRLKSLLNGRGVSSGLDISVKKYTAYYEALYDFVTYKIGRIDAFVTKQMVSGFRFQNKSDRDPYYGESIYENTLENKHAIYGISNGVCRSIVELFSGLAKDSTSAPTGLRGTETVAVGITPALMDKYGLYKHEVYFELPRYLSAMDNDGDNEEIDDYSWLDEIGFTLYISDENEDGTRYIASEAYDIIAKIDGERFGFLDYSFVDFWSRRELMLIDVAYLDEMRIEFNMEDMQGIYHLDITHKDVYWSQYGDRYTVQPDPNEIATDKADEIDVIVTPSGNLTPNKLLEYMDKKGYSAEGGSGFVSISEFYREMLSGGVPHYIGHEHIGIDDFKELLQIIYFTSYSGTVPQSEQAQIIATAPMIFRMAVKLDEHSTANVRPYYYVYEFYRYEDSRVLVRLYQAEYNSETGEYIPKTTPVSDFYITTFAMKKILTGYDKLFNLIDVDKESPYN